MLDMCGAREQNTVFVGRRGNRLKHTSYREEVQLKPNVEFISSICAEVAAKVEDDEMLQHIMHAGFVPTILGPIGMPQEDEIAN